MKSDLSKKKRINLKSGEGYSLERATEQHFNETLKFQKEKGFQHRTMLKWVIFKGHLEMSSSSFQSIKLELDMQPSCS